MKIPVNQSVLKWARESSNMSLQDVAHLMKKEVDTILQWENGLDHPSYAQLEKLAYQVYRRPLAVFFFPEPPREESPRKSFRTLPDTEYSRLPNTMIKMFRTAQAMQLKAKELCNEVNPKTRKIHEDFDFTTLSDVVRVARIIREYLQISVADQLKWKTTENALRIWRKTIEENGIFVFKDAFKQDEFSGFCFYDSEFPVIYINNSMPKTRQIFTLFHELAHLLFKTGGIDKIKENFEEFTSQDSAIEVFCNAFASEFLVPKDDFDNQIRGQRITNELYTKLSQRYHVSREVILRKLLDRDLVSQRVYEEKATLWADQAINGLRKKAGGNYYFTKFVYLGESYTNLAFQAYYKNRISEVQLAEYLNVKVSHVSGLEAVYMGSDAR